MTEITLNHIGIVHSPYKQKFAIPRQPGLVAEGRGLVELLAPYNHIDTVRQLEQFSHLWLIFIFHETQHRGWKALVRPPRLGGNKKVGVFASRATYRPNPIGMSAVKFEGVVHKDKRLFIDVSGIDLLDQTPIVDIKPYLPYSDSVTRARGGYAIDKPPAQMCVLFSDVATLQIRELVANYPQLEQFIVNVLKQDPRPAYKSTGDDNKTYSIDLYDLNIKWRINNNQTTVLTVVKIT